MNQFFSLCIIISFLYIDKIHAKSNIYVGKTQKKSPEIITFDDSSIKYLGLSYNNLAKYWAFNYLRAYGSVNFELEKIAFESLRIQAIDKNIFEAQIALFKGFFTTTLNIQQDLDVGVDYLKDGKSTDFLFNVNNPRYPTMGDFLDVEVASEVITQGKALLKTSRRKIKTSRKKLRQAEEKLRQAIQELKQTKKQTNKQTNRAEQEIEIEILKLSREVRKKYQKSEFEEVSQKKLSQAIQELEQTKTQTEQEMLKLSRGVRKKYQKYAFQGVSQKKLSQAIQEILKFKQSVQKGQNNYALENEKAINLAIKMSNKLFQIDEMLEKEQNDYVLVNKEVRDLAIKKIESIVFLFNKNKGIMFSVDQYFKYEDYTLSSFIIMMKLLEQFDLITVEQLKRLLRFHTVINGRDYPLALSIKVLEKLFEVIPSESVKSRIIELLNTGQETEPIALYFLQKKKSLKNSQL